MSSLDRILPFLRPIEDLLRDPAITELMVNDGGQRVFVERNGGPPSAPSTESSEVPRCTVSHASLGSSSPGATVASAAYRRSRSTTAKFDPVSVGK